MRFALACVGVIGLVSFSAAEARARDFSITLEYAAAAGCPDAAALETVVSARLGYDPFTEAAADHVAVRITPRGASLEGRIEWRDAGGKWAGDQTFRVGSAECRGLLRTMALALAVQIQLLADARTTPPADAAAADAAPSPREQTAPPRAATPLAATPSAEPATDRPSAKNVTDSGSARGESRALRPAFAIGAGTSLAFGFSAQPVLLGRAFGSLAGQHLSVELGAEVSLPETTRRADGAGFSQQALLATAAGCAALEPWRLCVVASAGEVRMAGKDVDRPSSAAVPLFDVGARACLVQPLTHRFFLSARAEALLHFTRWTARLDEVPVWTAPPFAAVVGIDAGVNIF